MENKLRNPVAATLICPELSLLACMISLIKGEYTNQIFSSLLNSNIINGNVQLNLIALPGS